MAMILLLTEKKLPKNRCAIALVLALSACNQAAPTTPVQAPQVPASAPVEATAPEPDPFHGLWRFESDVWNCSMARCQTTGTLLVMAGSTPGTEAGRLNISTSTYNPYAPPGSENPLVTATDGAEQDCVVLRSALTVSIQCSVDRQRFPNWTADSFVLQVNESNGELNGNFVVGPGVGVRFWKVS